ncbi:hypothetical protein KFK09_025905 [Dendrobium nobile]|uniref:Uncharacterized protein n=1 Tax=Dendrobium nobile TaxID=94219 RepID=A0A8T3ABC0_DENNO|nr:hypothetical protein KFK09_025905 [Dendrobium nobile]
MRYFEEREKAEEREKRRKKWKSGFSDDAEPFSSEVAVEEIAVHEVRHILPFSIFRTVVFGGIFCPDFVSVSDFRPYLLIGSVFTA